MPGRVPLLNAKFTNAPDFDNQGVTGITGSGVFRSFTYTNVGGNTRVLQNSDLWRTVELTGNSLVTIQNNSVINANIGDEIVTVNQTGTTAFTTTGGATLSGDAIIIPEGRPGRLVYIGSNVWLLSGSKTNFFSQTVTDCCGSGLSNIYSNNSLFSTDSTAYANSFGTSLYTSSNIGGIVVVGGTGYTITSGAVTENPCALVNFNISYTVYDAFGNSGTLYSYVSVSILNPSEIMGVKFKTITTSGVYPCDNTNAASGTYYRSADVYGSYDPMCLNGDGVVVSLTVC